MVCIDYDGSIIDTCLVALTTAMHTVKLPSVQYDPAIDNQIVNMQEMKPLKVYNVPVSTTFAIFDEYVFNFNDFIVIILGNFQFGYPNRSNA